jgi:hypothetical protein
MKKFQLQQIAKGGIKLGTPKSLISHLEAAVSEVHRTAIFPNRSYWKYFSQKMLKIKLITKRYVILNFSDFKLSITEITCF